MIPFSFFMNPSPSSSPIPAPSDPSSSWYGGSIQYLLNISIIGAACLLLLFLLVKLRADHRCIPGLTALLSKLLAVYHAQIALHCGADASQFLHIECFSFFILATLSFVAVFAVLPLNLYAGAVAIPDEFARMTITHVAKGSPWLWLHFVLMVCVVGVAHFGISKMEEKLRITRFQDGSVGVDANAASNSVAIFTIMVQGVPKMLAADKGPLQEYFQHRYPGKVYRVVVPFDLCLSEDLASRWSKVQN